MKNKNIYGSDEMFPFVFLGVEAKSGGGGEVVVG